MDGGKQLTDLIRPHRPHQTRNFVAIAQEYQGRPKLYLEYPSQQLAFAVVHFDVAQLWMFGYYFLYRRACSLTMSAPGGAEVQQGSAWQLTDLIPGKGFFCVIHVGRNIVRTRHICSSPLESIPPRTRGAGSSGACLQFVITKT